MARRFTQIATEVFMFAWGCFHKTATESTFITTTGHMTFTWHGAACVDGEINKKPQPFIRISRRKWGRGTNTGLQIMEKSQTETFSGEKKPLQKRLKLKQTCSEHPPSSCLERLNASGHFAVVFYQHFEIIWRSTSSFSHFGTRWTSCFVSTSMPVLRRRRWQWVGFKKKKKKKPLKMTQEVKIGWRGGCGGYLLESEWLREKLTLGGFGEKDQVSEDGIKHIFSTLDGVLQRVPGIKAHLARFLS